MHSVQQLMPAGVVLPFAGTTAPKGYFICDGTMLSRTQYAALFAAIGTLHGFDDANTFRLPDFRGLFLRGADNGAARDPDRAARSAPYNGAATGAGVGSLQGHAFPAHAHALLGNSGNGGTAAVLNGSGAVCGTTNTAGLGYYANAPLGNNQYMANAGGSTETRPMNANVNYIIKY